MAIGGMFRSAVMALRMDTSGAVRDLTAYHGATGRADAMTKRFGGNVGLLQAQVGLVTAAVGFMGLAAFRAFAQFDRTAGLASIRAKEVGQSTGEFNDEIKDLSRELKVGRRETAAMISIINQFGDTVRGNEHLVASLGARLGILGEVDGVKAAEIMFRLAEITGENTPEGLRRTAGAINAVGKEVTAGVGELVKFLQQFQTVGVVSNLSATEIVALGGAISHLTPQMKELSTTAFSRAMTTENFSELARGMGMTVEQLKNLRRENPREFLVSLLATARDMQAGDSLLGFTKEAGLGEQRSIRGIAAAIAALNRLTGEDSLFNIAGSEGNFDQLMAESNDLLNDAQGSIDGLKEAWGGLTIAAGGFVGTVLSPLIAGFTKLFQTLEDNKALLMLFVGGIGILGVRAGGALAMSLGGRMGMGGATGKMLGAKGSGLGRRALAFGDFLTLGLFARGAAGRQSNRVAGLFGRGAGAIRGGLGRAAGFVGSRVGLGIGGLAAGVASSRFGGAIGAGMSRIGGSRPIQLAAAGLSKILPLVGGFGGLLLRLAGPVGLVISLVDPLRTMFEALGDKLVSLGNEKGGILGVFLKTIGFIAKVFQFVAAVIQAIIRVIVKVFKGVVDFINKIPGVSKLTEALSKGIDKMIDGVDNMTESVDKIGRTSEESADKVGTLNDELETTGAGAARVANQFSVFIGGRNFATEEFTSMIQAATGVSSASTTGGL